MKNSFYYRLSQLVSLLLGARFFVLIFISFALYVSAFFLINQEQDLRKMVFDVKLHGIIFCSVLSIAAGGLINQFYDKEKDKIIKPFRYKLQRFLKQKYFLYFYLILNILSIGIAGFLSWRILLFFIIYQFFIWLYSHKLSKILVLNNLTFVLLSLYPFFGILVYYQHFSMMLFWMALFLFLLMLSIDINKDIITKDADQLFQYRTFPIVVGIQETKKIIVSILMINAVVSFKIFQLLKPNIHSQYFLLSIVFFLVMCGIIFFTKVQHSVIHNWLRVWVLVGVIFMLINGLN